MRRCTGSRCSVSGAPLPTSSEHGEHPHLKKACAPTGLQTTPDAAEKLRRLVDAAWPALTELGLAGGVPRDNLVVTSTLEEAVAVAEFVQESAPEDLGLGQELLVKIDSATPAES